MATRHTSRITAYTIMGGIGDDALLGYIRTSLPASEFTSHDFTIHFPTFFPDEYERMLEVSIEYGDMPHRNQKIANSIGKYLWHHRHSLHIEKTGTVRNKNINGSISSASVWRKTL